MNSLEVDSYMLVMISRLKHNVCTLVCSCRKEEGRTGQMKWYTAKTL